MKNIQFSSFEECTNCIILFSTFLSVNLNILMRFTKKLEKTYRTNNTYKHIDGL